MDWRLEKHLKKEQCALFLMDHKYNWNRYNTGNTGHKYDFTCECDILIIHIGIHTGIAGNGHTHN